MSKPPNETNTSTDSYENNTYCYFALALLTLAYILSFIDRQILTILQEPIKAELGLSDTQLGLLTGFAFAMFYIAMGIPIARLADRGVRQTIIAVSVGVWSLFTAVSSMVNNYVQLLLVRIGVGIGEAGCTPPAHSMISDIFPAEKRATALSIYTSGVSIGILFGFLMGGWLNEYFGWRTAFIVVGVPGLLLAIILRIFLKEPPRGRFDPPRKSAYATKQQQVSFKEALAVLWRFYTFRHLMAAIALFSIGGYGMINWLPSFFIRFHGLGTGTIGTWFALILGVGGALGTIAAGYLSDRLGQYDRRWYCWLIAALMSMSVPMVVLLLSAETPQRALWFFVVPGALLAVYTAPIITIIHSLVENHMRAMSSAITFLFINAIGLGLGPVIIGFISDRAVDSLGNYSLRYALMSIVPVAYSWGITHTLLAARHLTGELNGLIVSRR